MNTVADGMSPVNPENPAALTCGNLRAMLARLDVRATEVAERRGTSPQAVRAALRGDLTGRPVSQTLLRGILDAVNAILLDREQTACLSR